MAPPSRPRPHKQRKMANSTSSSKSSLPTPSLPTPALPKPLSPPKPSSRKRKSSPTEPSARKSSLPRSDSSWVPFKIDPCYSGDPKPRDPREHLPSEALSAEYYESPTDRVIQDLENEILVLKNKISNLKTTEIEAQGTIEVLKKESLKQNRMITALQELVMKLCSKTNIHDGSEAYLEVGNDCQSATSASG